MLENLRQIIEEDNRIEDINELMVEATDSAIMDMFIDEDGEAEIPESELNKILSKIPEYNQEEELNKRLKRLTESYIPDYDEINTLEENMDYFDSDYDTLEESKESRDAKFDAKMEKIYRNQVKNINDIQELEVTIRKNTELYKQITSAINTKEAKLDDSNIKRLLGEFKDRVLFLKYDPFNPGENTPLSILKRNLRNNRICDKVLRDRLKELKKSNKKAAKESMSLYETAQSIVDDLF